jgi:hypothetical protein
MTDKQEKLMIRTNVACTPILVMSALWLKSASSFYLCARFSRIGIQELRFFDISNLVVQEKL